MSDRQAQEFWDQMWYWEKYEHFPSETTDDPHLVVQLASQVDSAQSGGNQPDPELFARYDQCVGRVLNRVSNMLPRSGANADREEFASWLRFGLNPDVRGHDAAITPIIDANSLVIFRFFVKHAIDYCRRHGLDELLQLWEGIADDAKEVDEQHQGSPGDSRFSGGGN